MSNQESQNQGKTKEAAGVEKRRRFMKGAGIVAPVVLTLSSPSVFGIQCGSEIASGNESQVGEGSCTAGQNPAYWSNPANRIEWPAPYDYGTLIDSTNTSPSCTDFNGGTTFDAAFGTPLASITGSDDRPMRVILCSTETADTLKKDLVAALLNASIIPNTYPLNDVDVKSIQAGTGAVPTYPSEIPAIAIHVTAYLETTF